MTSIANRYSETELNEFKTLIEKKLQKTQDELQFILDQIDEMKDNDNREGDRIDDTSNQNDLEMLSTMSNRHYTHIRALKNALLRIHNKSYGICATTGQQIDKRRLKAVPTTTQCLAAKIQPIVAKEKKSQSTSSKNKRPKIISKTIQKKKHDTSEPNNNHVMDQDHFDQFILDEEANFEKLNRELKTNDFDAD